MQEFTLAKLSAMNIAVSHVQTATMAGSIGHKLGEMVIVIESLSDKSCVALSYHNDINSRGQPCE